MKSIENLKEFCEFENEEIIVRLTPYEIYLLKTAVINWQTDIELEMSEYDWENNENNKKRIKELNALYKDLREIPF